MKIIVGLGNPGKEYTSSRHNTGFRFLDELAQDKELSVASDFKLEKKFEAEVLECAVNGEKLLLIKPQTFMNLSGKTVAAVLDYYKLEPKDLIVISDDLDLPVGFLRVRHEGSSGGQKGLQSIIDSIGTDQFIRFRIGILESKEKIDQAMVNNYVLGPVGKRALPILSEIITLGVDYLIKYLKENKPIPAHTLEVKDRV